LQLIRRAQLFLRALLVLMRDQGITSKYRRSPSKPRFTFGRNAFHHLFI